MITKVLSVLLLSHLAVVSAISTCCNGSNILLPNRTCSDGYPPKKLSCARKVILPKDDEFTIGENDTLLIYGDDVGVPPDKYCFTIMPKFTTNNETFILCNDEEDTARMDITLINVLLSFISVVFIVLTILVYITAPGLLDLQGICLVQSISGLAFSFIILGIINLNHHISPINCDMLAHLMYLSFMYAFFWLNIVCFHIWRMIVNPKILRSIKRWFLIYHVFGILGPLALLAFILTVSYADISYFKDIHPGMGVSKCWFETPTSTMIYFYGPISLLLSVNIIYFIWTTIVLWKEMTNCSEKKTKILKYRLRLCVKLFFVMGIPWCFEVISAIFENSTSKWIWVLPDTLNALQGLLIFLILVVFRKKAVRALANKKIFSSIRLPASWRHAQDDECEELEEELSLSGVQQKTEIIKS